MPWYEKVRYAVIGLLGVLFVSYSVFSVWYFSPMNTYDKSQTFNMILVDRWDASYNYKGSYQESFKGLWKDQQSGNTKTLTIDSYTMNRMHLGEVVPMEFTPSELNLIERPNQGIWFFCSLCIFLWCFGTAMVTVAWLVGAFSPKRSEW